MFDIGSGKGICYKYLNNLFCCSQTAITFSVNPVEEAEMEPFTVTVSVADDDGNGNLVITSNKSEWDGRTCNVEDITPFLHAFTQGGTAIPRGCDVISAICMFLDDKGFSSWGLSPN